MRNVAQHARSHRMTLDVVSIEEGIRQLCSGGHDWLRAPGAARALCLVAGFRRSSISLLRPSGALGGHVAQQRNPLIAIILIRREISRRNLRRKRGDCA